MEFLKFLNSFTTTIFGILGVFVAVQGLTLRRNKLVSNEKIEGVSTSGSQCLYPKGSIKNEIVDAEQSYSNIKSKRSLSSMSHFNNQYLVKISRLPNPPIDKLFMGGVTFMLRLFLIPYTFVITLYIFDISSDYTFTTAIVVFFINILLPSYIYKSRDCSASVVSGFGYFGEVDSILCNIHRDEFGHVSASFDIYSKFLGGRVIFTKKYKARSMEDCVHEYLGLIDFCDVKKLGYYSIDHESNDIPNIIIKDIRFGFIRTMVYVAYLLKSPFILLSRLKNKR